MEAADLPNQCDPRIGTSHGQNVDNRAGSDVLVATWAVDHARRSKENLEGPTYRQAAKMAERRARLVRQAAETDNDERAFDLDCEVWDIERDLLAYGFDPDTGKVNRKRRAEIFGFAG